MRRAPPARRSRRPGDHRERFAQHEPAHVAAARAERQAQAEFRAAARDAVGHHAIEADAREQQRDARRTRSTASRRAVPDAWRCAGETRPSRCRAAASTDRCGARLRAAPASIPPPDARRLSCAPRASVDRGRWAYARTVEYATAPIGSRNPLSCRSPTTPTMVNAPALSIIGSGLPGNVAER